MRGLLIVLMSLTLATTGFAQSRHGSAEAVPGLGRDRSLAAGPCEAAMPVAVTAEDT